MNALRSYAETAIVMDLSIDEVREIEQRAFRKLRRDRELRKLLREASGIGSQSEPVYNLASSWPLQERIL